MEKHYILVDYANIDKKDIRFGLDYFLEKLLFLLDRHDIDDKKRIEIRLYSGWYLNDKLTRIAEKVIAECAGLEKIKIMQSEKKMINVNLAYSLLILDKHLYSTFRPRSMPKGLKCLKPNNHCGVSECPLSVVADFINEGSISNQCCDLKPEDIIFMGAQKLVDSMILSDMLYLGISMNQNVTIVSSDDDFWPGILMLNHFNKKVVHVNTKKRKSGNIYLKNIIARDKYIKKQL